LTVIKASAELLQRKCCIAGLQLLKTLEGIHKLGYIHRDVKPANFGVTPIYEGPRNGKWRAFDFGIARKFVDDLSQVIPAREDFKEFRGSTTYASVHAHAKQDLGNIQTTLVLLLFMPLHASCVPSHCQNVSDAYCGQRVFAGFITH
jgi:serine/threonine protein kinase